MPSGGGTSRSPRSATATAFPVTNEGRIVGVVLLTIGVGLFGTFTAFIANLFLGPR